MLSAIPLSGFNPWYVGGGVKSHRHLGHERQELGFNPWYVGGGVKSKTYYTFTGATEVSILGMLEGVLKGSPLRILSRIQSGFNPWYVGGGVKSQAATELLTGAEMFQSLVCWRGC